MNNYKKAKKCSIPDNILTQLVTEMTNNSMCWGEITSFINSRIKGAYSLEGILCILNSRNYMVMEEKKQGRKTYYRIVNKEYYRKIEEEHRENAKRRLLAAVSY